MAMGDDCQVNISAEGWYHRRLDTQHAFKCMKCTWRLYNIHRFKYFVYNLYNVGTNIGMFTSVTTYAISLHKCIAWCHAQVLCKIARSALLMSLSALTHNSLMQSFLQEKSTFIYMSPNPNGQVTSPGIVACSSQYLKQCTKLEPEVATISVWKPVGCRGHRCTMLGMQLWMLQSPKQVGILAESLFLLYMSRVPGSTSGKYNGVCIMHISKYAMGKWLIII